MKTNLIKKIVISIGLIIVIAIASSFSYAASISIAAGSTNITVGSSTTLTIRANNVTGRINISSSNPGVISISSSSEWIENGTITVKATAKAAGSAYITVSSADTSDSSTGEQVSVSTGVNLTAKNVVVDTRSSNNYLSSLNIEGYELSPAFNANNNNYTINVKSDVKEINVSAIPADTKSKTIVSGNLDLVAGENNVTVTVTAENGYKRVYTITVTKDKDPDDIDATIETLTIKNAILKNEFKSDVYEYMCEDITADINKLDIELQTKIAGIKYEITGNDELKQGINHITIKVTSRDGSETKEYKIIVFKTDEVLALEDVESVIADTPNTTFLDKIKSVKYELIVIVSLLLLLIIVIVSIFVVRKKKLKNNNSFIEETLDNEIEPSKEVDHDEIQDEIIENEITDKNEIQNVEIQNVEQEDSDEKVEVEEVKVRKGRTVENKKQKSKKIKLDDNLETIEEIDVTLDLPNLDDSENEK